MVCYKNTVLYDWMITVQLSASAKASKIFDVFDGEDVGEDLKGIDKKYAKLRIRRERHTCYVYRYCPAKYERKVCQGLEYQMQSTGTVRASWRIGQACACWQTNASRRIDQT